MITKRYLIYFSYIGTNFRGVQRQAPRELDDPATVQGLIDYAVGHLKPINKPITILASRTDAGVHALKSACTVDLNLSIELDTSYIHNFLNKFFNAADVPIRVNDVLWVPWEFNCRKSPLWRRYIYRFAILKPNMLPENKTKYFTLPIPVSEYDRCHFVRETNFDFDEACRACEVFVGPQDYVAFLGKPNSGMHKEDLITVRLCHKVFLEKAHPYVPTDVNDYYNYYHFTVEGKSFIYNQVRKMVAMLLAIGQHKMVIDDLRQMFIDPSPASWPSKLELLPACGLYLSDIFYDPKDLELPEDIKEEVRNPRPPSKLELKRLNMESEKIIRSLADLKTEKYSKVLGLDSVEE